MLRRNPTRIELKLEDIKEYEAMKNERLKQNAQKMSVDAVGEQSSSSTGALPGTCSGDTTPGSKTKAQFIREIQERIGYDPKPQLGTSRIRTPIHN
ncbi:anaphase-promoting complex subunit CDC26 [Octopus bimaculoides]|uniref:Anaphase-promoting complex subunit CDC26 n=1 Tax=Octopus bimaculoides TaxID=37653 RepID=A0A0L8HLP2_OCTBM|nr:anaphase-promoting complex subunit CDC26 [Octopus bimaculoides]|eukprot:XP_014771314.1 PREDICTED: anaphase-promoting complex subunit CDC26-like [Octopus bimaculoides]